MINNPDFRAVQKKEKKRFMDYVGSGKKVMRQNGVFGEWYGCDGYVEFPPLTPKEGGTYTKIFGCSYLFRGYPEILRIRGMAAPKFLFSGLITHVVRKSWIYALAMGVKYLFFRKRFFYDLDYIAFQIQHRIIHTNDIPENYYNEPIRELKRAWNTTIDKVFKIEYYTHNIEVIADKPTPITEALHWTKVRERKLNPLGYFLWRFGRFLFLSLELDNAYRFRMQDAICNDVFKTLETMQEREQADLNEKTQNIKLALKVAFIFQPKLKRFIKDFFQGIDLEKVRLSEADRYFTLQYVSYNFEGKPKEERFKEREEIDEEKGHTFFIGQPKYEVQRETPQNT